MIEAVRHTRASSGHPFRRLAHDVYRLETRKRLAMAGNGGFVESADELLIVFGHSLVLRPRLERVGACSRAFIAQTHRRKHFSTDKRSGSYDVSEQVEGQPKRLKDKGKAQKGAATFRKFTVSRDEDVEVSGVLKYSSAGVLRFKCITPLIHHSSTPVFAAIPA